MVEGPTGERLNCCATLVGNQPLVVRVRLLKSPLRMASVGRSVATCRKSSRHLGSYAKKKKLLSWPLYSLGITTGPPTVKEPWLNLRKLVGGFVAPDQSLALVIGLRVYHSAVP